jgi:hypothetical protein
MLVVSGHRMKRGGAQSWYSALSAAALGLPGVAADADAVIAHGAPLPKAAHAGGGPVSATGIAPTRDDAGTAGDGVHDPRMTSPIMLPGTARRTDPLPDSNAAALRYGEAFHRLIEMLTSPVADAPRSSGGDLQQGLQSRIDSMAPADHARLREALLVGSADFERLLRQAQRVLCSAQLLRFFDRSCHLRARNELAYLAADGALRRIDRLVEFDAEVWVLDYKTGDRDAIAPWLDGYRAQVTDYARAMRPLYPSKRMHAALVLGDGSLLEVALDD